MVYRMADSRILQCYVIIITYRRQTFQQICIIIPDIKDLKSTMAASYLRDNLENYGPASNLAHNEKIREMIADGRPIYHFGFGQSPFPLLDTAVEALKRHASKSAYLPVAGL